MEGSFRPCRIDCIEMVCTEQQSSSGGYMALDEAHGGIRERTALTTADEVEEYWLLAIRYWLLVCEHTGCTGDIREVHLSQDAAVLGRPVMGITDSELSRMIAITRSPAAVIIIDP